MGTPDTVTEEDVVSGEVTSLKEHLAMPAIVDGAAGATLTLETNF